MFEMMESIQIHHNNIPCNNLEDKFGCIIAIIAYSKFLHNSNNSYMGFFKNPNIIANFLLYYWRSNYLLSTSTSRNIGVLFGIYLVSFILINLSNIL